MAIFENLSTLSGAPLDEAELQGRAVLVVNVASHCGLTPQYTGLEQLQERYGERGFTVLGVPCNQFGEQEPGSAQEIQTFCSTTYGVSFPMTEKLDVNGPERHPLYSALTATVRRRWRGGRRAMELREVPRLRRRAPGGALSPHRRARVPAADRGDRVGAPLLMAATPALSAPSVGAPFERTTIERRELGERDVQIEIKLLRHLPQRHPPGQATSGAARSSRWSPATRSRAWSRRSAAR